MFWAAISQTHLARLFIVSFSEHLVAHGIEMIDCNLMFIGRLAERLQLTRVLCLFLLRGAFSGFAVRHPPR